MILRLLASFLASLLLAAPVLAADKSGVKPQSISLPSGPGSIEGLGESFEPQLNTGAASYRAAFEVPPGRAGHTPELALEYSSGSGNGHFGIGWNLSLVSIQRQTDKHQPYYTDGDVFVHSSGEELVPLADGSWRCENESAFLRIRRSGDGWEVRDKSGRIHRLGTYPNESDPDRRSRIEFDGAGFDRTFRWLVDSSEDSSGNRIDYLYEPLPDSPGELYLRQVRYNEKDGNYQSVALGYQTRSDAISDFRSGFEMRTAYRGSHVTVLSQGAVIREYALSYQREVPGASGLDALQGKISLLEEVRQYGAGGAGASYLPPLRFEYSALRNGDADLPPTDNFPGPEDVDADRDGVIDETSVESIVNPPPAPALQTGEADLVDLNGDGLPDLVTTDTNPHRYYPNLGRGEFGEADSMAADGSEVRLSDAAASMADLDGDSLADLVLQPGANPGNQGFRMYRNQGNGTWAPSVEFTGITPSLGDAKTRLFDIDFDKSIDIVRTATGSSWTACRRTSDADIDFPPYGNFPGDEDLDRNANGQRDGGAWGCSQVDTPIPAALTLDTPGVQLADMNGDRLQDFVWLQRTDPSRRAVWYWRHRGEARFEAQPVVMTIDGTASTEIDLGVPMTNEEAAERVKLADVTGDGLTDILLVTSGEVLVWVNIAGERWSAPLRFTDTPEFDPAKTSLRLADMNGNGSTDLLWVRSIGPENQHWQFLDFAPGAKPNQLVAIDNGLGRRTYIQYRSSVEYAIDASEARPPNPWKRTSPVVMPLVSQIVVTPSVAPDRSDHYVTDFVYRDAFYDGYEREFRGFGFVKKIERGNVEEAPTRITRISFHVGGADGIDNDGDKKVDERSALGGSEEESLKGRILWQEVTSEGAGTDSAPGDGDFADDSLVFQRTENHWQIRPLYSLLDRQVSFAFNEREATSLLEQQHGPVRTVETQYQYDDFGNVTRESSAGALEIDGDERYTCKEYAAPINCLDCWNQDKPKKVTLASDPDCTNVFKQTKYFYDGPDFEGLPLGQLTRGLISREEAFVSLGEVVQQARTRFDQFGNPRAILDGLGNPANLSFGHARELDYDPVFGVHPVRETIHVGGGREPLVMIAAYELGLGVMTESTDFNGNRTRYGYDAFGRLTSITRPFDSVALPTVVYEYRMADPYRQLLYEYDRNGALTRTGGSTTIASAVITRAREASGFDGTFDSAQFVDGMGRRLGAIEEAEAGYAVKEAVAFNARGTVRDTYQPYLTASLEYALPSGGPRTTVTYDELGREHVRTNPPESEGGPRTEATTEYTPLVRTHTDELGNEKVLANDGLDRLVRVEEVNRGQRYVTTYDYNAADSLVRITDAQNNVRRFEYDGLQRKTLLADPDRGYLSYFYDAASNLRETVDARGQSITYTYDGVNRLLTEDYLDEGLVGRANRSPDVQYHYDDPAGAIDQGDGTPTTARQTRGFLSWVDDLSGQEHLSYDERGRATWTIKRVARQPNGTLVSYRTERSYDALDRVESLLYPDGDRIEHTYNNRSLLESISGGPSGAIIASIEYRPSGQMDHCVYGNGVQTAYAYDPRLRMRSLRSALPAAPTGPLLDYAYSFDAASNIQRIDDRRLGTYAPAGSPRRNTQIFSYDDLYRLEGVRYSFALPGQTERNDGDIQYRYDRIGNLISQSSTISDLENGLPVADLGALTYAGGRSGRGVREPQDPPGPHALTRVGTGAQRRDLTYDANGNVTSFEGKTLTWDFKDRLVAVEDASMRAEYGYDYTDRRITKRVSRKTPTGATEPPPPETTTYVDRTFELREHGQTVKYVFTGETRVARITGTLDPSAERIQRFPVHPGWNLLSLALDAADAAAQLVAEAAVERIYRWDPAARDFEPVSAGMSLPAGSVFWLQARSEAELEVRGRATAITIPPATVTGAFLPVVGGALNLAASLPDSVDRTWLFDAKTQTWRGRFSGALSMLSSAPDFVAPGEAIYVRAAQDVPLLLPSTARQILYYHEDHLGSSDVVADAAGALVEANTIYPFGHPRQRFRPPQKPDEGLEAYLFSQKEFDHETGLQYFEARFLDGLLSRFLSVDPVVASPSEASLHVPQVLHAYSFAASNPIVVEDPTGEVIPLLVAGALALWTSAEVGVEVGSAINKQIENRYWIPKQAQEQGKSLNSPELKARIRENNIGTLKDVGSASWTVVTSKVRVVQKVLGPAAKSINKISDKIPQLDPAKKLLERTAKWASQGFGKAVKKITERTGGKLDLRTTQGRELKDLAAGRIEDEVGENLPSALSVSEIGPESSRAETPKQTK
jgi:RHS repeat-associated protein